MIHKIILSIAQQEKYVTQMDFVNNIVIEIIKIFAVIQQEMNYILAKPDLSNNQLLHYLDLSDVTHMADQPRKKAKSSPGNQTYFINVSSL